MVVTAQQRAAPYLLVLLSALAFFLAWGGGHVFSSSALVRGDDWGNENGGYSTREFLGLLLQTALLPVSVACFMVGMPHVVRSPTRPLTKAAVLLLSETILLSCAGVAFSAGANRILRCGVVFCLFAESNDDGYESYSFSSYTTISLTVYFFILLFFAFLVAGPFCGAVAAICDGRRAARETHRRMKGGIFREQQQQQQQRMEESFPSVLSWASANSSSGSPSVERASEGERALLLGSQSSTPPAAPSSKSSKRNGCRGLGAPLAYFLVGLPIFLSAAAILPDLWLYFLPSGIQALAESPESKDDDTTAGPVVSFKVMSISGRPVYAKLWPDTLLFYHAIYLAAAVGLLARRCGWGASGSRGGGGDAGGGGLILGKRPRFQSAWLRSASSWVSVGGVSVGTLLLGGLTALLLAALFAYWYIFHGWGYAKVGDTATAERVARSLGQVMK